MSLEWILILAFISLGAFGYIEKIFNIHISRKIQALLLLIFLILSIGQSIKSKYREDALERNILQRDDHISILGQKIEDEKKNSLQLKNEINSVRGFLSIAGLDALGNPPGFAPGGDLKYSSELTIMLEGTYTIEDGSIHMSRSPESESKYRAIIKKYPRFPFAYYYLVLCLRDRGDSSWKIYAEQAIEILKETTKIDGHNQNHDEVLGKLQGFMNNS